ncbi:MAG: ATP-dependent helicase [Candidatus Omnitrophica bacterium]|nr:ATP-dependent helicase [Candidatus Omnitrophota bacterium]
MKIDYKKELNPAQLKAVESTEGAYLVIAGAGSGKTRTLVYRVAYLVEKGVRPDHILLLTFTRKASEEMLRRAAKLLDDRCERVAGGTFHSFANMVLRKYAKLIDFPNNFTITDESDAEDAVNIVREKLGLGHLEKRFPRKGALLDVISKSVNKSEDIGSVLALEYPQFAEWEGEIKRIKDGYIKYKREKSLMDYDDLLVFLKKLLHDHKDVREKLSGQYKYIMVDEYQDTNKLQAEIVRLLASGHGNVMVVGDDSQSIYSFRGANFKNIIDFPKVFKGAKVIMLEENYRSTQPILDLTNEVIRNAEEKFEKTLFTKKGAGKAPVFVEARDENVQSKYIVQKILELVEDGVGLKDIAVLFRAGWHSNDLEIELANHDVPFLKYGGQRFVEAAHIKDVLSYLRIAHNPHDQVSWRRALMLMRGIGEKTAGRITAQIIEKKQGFDLDEETFRKHPDLADLMDILKGVKPLEHQPGALIKGFLEYYGPLLKAKYDDYHKRAPDLNSLERIAGRYKSLESFLTDMALEPPEKSILEAGLKGRHDHSMTLSTIHSAKGLEWHTVFLIYVAEGHMPSYQAMDDKDAIEEERRLFYVAATRAKENLILLKPAIDRSARWMKNYSGGYSGSIFTEVSRFLQEGSILERFMDVEKAGGDFDDVEFEDVI